MIYTDRSRYVVGLQECMYERYLRYHVMGTGIELKGNAVPLATGIHVHSCLEHILKYAKEHDKCPPSEFISEVTDTEAKLYDEEVSNAGFYDVEEATEISNTVAEQSTLVSGLVLCWSKFTLPWLIEQFEIVEVETEEQKILGCDCGLSGIGDVPTHVKRGCNGVCFMSRPDIIAAKRDTGTLSYHEIKTDSNPDQTWAQSFENNIQFATGVAAAEARIGKDIDELYVHGLNKGFRSPVDYNKYTGKYEGPLRQKSPLCYSYVRPHNPPFTKFDIKPEYQWYGEDGKRHRVTNQYTKMATWEIQFPDKPDTIKNIEYLVGLLAPETLAKQINLVGPIPTPRFQIETLLREMEAEERRWDYRIQSVKSVVEANEGDWFHPDVLDVAEGLIPRSWKCRRYKRHKCSFVPICFQHDGWNDPLNRMDYKRRMPHHPIEMEEGEFEV